MAKEPSLKSTSPFDIPVWMFMQGELRERTISKHSLLHFCYVTCLSKFDFEALIWWRIHHLLFQHESIHFFLASPDICWEIWGSYTQHKHICHSLIGICIQCSALYDKITKKYAYARLPSAAFSPFILIENMMWSCQTQWKAIVLLIWFSVEILYNSIHFVTLCYWHYWEMKQGCLWSLFSHICAEVLANL